MKSVIDETKSYSSSWSSLIFVFEAEFLLTFFKTFLTWTLPFWPPMLPLMMLSVDFLALWKGCLFGLNLISFLAWILNVTSLFEDLDMINTFWSLITYFCLWSDYVFWYVIQHFIFFLCVVTVVQSTVLITVWIYKRVEKYWKWPKSGSFCEKFVYISRWAWHWRFDS